MVNDKDVAWHAGKSKWKKDKNLNNCSIGIELINNGNEEFPNIQIISLIKLLKKLLQARNKNKQCSWAFRHFPW